MWKPTYIDISESVDEGYLTDWYISSVSADDSPVWTDEHISELVNDFYIIPKSVAVEKGHEVNYTVEPKEKLIDRDIIIAELQRCIQMELDMGHDNECNFAEDGTDCGLIEESLRVFANGVVQGLNVAITRIKFLSTDAIENDESEYTDEVGGHHDSGVGWNSNGVWCGECSRATCDGCVNQNITKAVWEE